MSVPVYAQAAGIVLVFFLPGFLVAKAIFPEFRVRRAPDPIRQAVVLTTLSLVLSVALTILVGFGLLSLAPGGFQAAWSDPVLEVILLAIALIAFAAGWFRGAYSKVPVTRPPTEAPLGGEEGAWELQRELDRLRLKERRLIHRLRSVAPGTPEEGRIQHEIETIRAANRELRESRQAEYAR